MWYWLTIIDKRKNIQHEPIMFHTEDFKVIIHNEDNTIEYFNSENGDQIETRKMDQDNAKTSKEE